MTEKPYQPIANYGIIGNLHTVALVSLQGSIDFMCFTRFDSPTIFASLLDSQKGGFFDIKPDKKEKLLFQKEPLLQAVSMSPFCPPVMVE